MVDRQLRTSNRTVFSPAYRGRNLDSPTLLAGDMVSNYRVTASHFRAELPISWRGRLIADPTTDLEGAGLERSVCKDRDKRDFEACC